MSKFQPERLAVEYRDGVTATTPVIPRCYTLTHSDATGDLFLTIGLRYAWDKINAMRDDIAGTWTPSGASLYYAVYVYIDQGEYNQQAATKRNDIFKRELPLALTAIRYGDRALFDTYPQLDEASIIIRFMSTYPQLARQENWGVFRNFLL